MLIGVALRNNNKVRLLGRTLKYAKNTMLSVSAPDVIALAVAGAAVDPFAVLAAPSAAAAALVAERVVVVAAVVEGGSIPGAAVVVVAPVADERVAPGSNEAVHAAVVAAPVEQAVCSNQADAVAVVVPAVDELVVPGSSLVGVAAVVVPVAGGLVAPDSSSAADVAAVADSSLDGLAEPVVVFLVASAVDGCFGFVPQEVFAVA